MDATDTVNPMGFDIEPEFRDLLPPAEEWRTESLLIDLREHGVLDPLKVWQEKNILLDGHRRVELLTDNTDILEQHGEPGVVYLSFSSDAEAKAWMIGYQNCRRSVSKVAMAVTEGLKVEPKKRGPKDCYNDVTNPESSTTERVGRTRHKQAAEGWQEVAKVDADAAQSIIGEKDTPVTQKDLRSVATAPQESRRERAEAVAAKAKGKPHVSNNSGENEWYTPPAIIESARLVMGGIELDPASSDKAQEVIQADRYYTAQDDGLTQIWQCQSLWINPPYSQPLISEFVKKFCESWNMGDIGSACVLVNNATETQWFQRLAILSSAICFLRGRVKFHDSTGKPANTPLQGQAVLYYGDDSPRFAKEFEILGLVMEAHNYE